MSRLLLVPWSLQIVSQHDEITAKGLSVPGVENWRTPLLSQLACLFFFFLLKFHFGLSNLWSFRILTVKTPIRSEHVVREQFLPSLFPRWFLVRYEGGQQYENGLLVSSRLMGCEALGGREEESVRWWVFSAARMLKLTEHVVYSIRGPCAFADCSWLGAEPAGKPHQNPTRPFWKTQILFTAHGQNYQLTC